MVHFHASPAQAATRPDRLELLGRLVFAEEQERRRVAREMHDQFGQRLAALRHQTGRLKADCDGNATLLAEVEAIEAIANRLDEHIDFLSRELRPAALDDLGLHAALSNYVKYWAAHSGISAEMQASGFAGDRLRPEIETTLYRIAQEALSNVAKHARAGRADVILDRRADHVSLIVEDDGVGFDASETGVAGRGLGLLRIEERATLVAATAQIESSVGRGTTIVVRVPTPTPSDR